MHEGDLRLLITLDAPWNARERDAFNDRQAGHGATVRPGQPAPTRGGHDRRAEGVIANDSYEVTSSKSAGNGHHHELF